MPETCPCKKSSFLNYVIDCMLMLIWQGNNTHQTDKDLNDLLWFSKLSVLTEATLEAAPQFIIQLYAMAVQQQSVSIIQIVNGFPARVFPEHCLGVYCC